MRKVHILWAEDNPATLVSFLEKLKVFLEDRGVLAEFTIAENGDAVFRHLSSAEQKFDLLLTDIVMPQFNGINTVKILNKQYPGLPMIIVSAYTESEEYASILSDLKEHKIISDYFSLQSGEVWFEAAWRALTQRAPNILHLSDIHFGSDHAFQGRLKINDLISLALGTIVLKGPIDLVVISGDLTSRGTEEEFSQAEEFLSSLASTLNLSHDRFVIVPGNHDIYRDEETGRRFSKFVEFLDSFYRKLSNPNIAFERYPELYDSFTQRLHWKAKKHSEESLYSISIYDELKTIIIGLNSVISSGEGRLNFSKIEPKQLIKIATALNALRPPQSNYLRIAVFHHNPFSVPSFTDEGEPERVVRNPALVLHELIKNQVRLILHGHAHYSIGFQYLPFFLDEDRRVSNPLYVFGAGTLSGKDLVVSQSYYHLTVIRCAVNEGGNISTASLTPYRLKDDWLDWESILPVNIIF
jgi:CheY-like chemotaxis protein/Icc-related predicted phosphoesterase